MKKYIIFGVSHYLSDIFDIIHANNGKVTKIFQNIPMICRKGETSLKKRISLLGYKIEHHNSLDEFKPMKDCEYVIGCTTVKKYSLAELLKKKYGIEFSKLIHPKAHIGSNVDIGEGVIVSPGAVIAPNVRLGDFCVINRAVSIGHDATIGKYSRIGPSAALGGFSRIGHKTQIGMNASILDHIHVGNDSVIGAGAVVNKDIPDKVVAFGVPARVKIKNEEADI